MTLNLHGHQAQGADAAGRSLSGDMVAKVALLAVSAGIIPLLTGSLWPLVAVSAAGGAAFALIHVLDRAVAAPRRRRLVGALWIALSLAGLIFANAFGAIGTLTGTAESLAGQWLILVGASFYVLQIAGVAASVMWREIAPPRFLDFLNFTLLGFKFASGPMEKAHLIGQLAALRFAYDARRAAEGLSWAVLGFFMVFAMASGALTLTALAPTDPINVIIGAILLELRFYFNFAGYSFLVYGLAMVVGIDLTLNFRHPYFAANPREFWRRWHVSLGRWLHHYLYRPIRQSWITGADRGPLVAAGLFVISALWHGATPNFALWGLIHLAAYLFYVRSGVRWFAPAPLALALMWCLLVLQRIIYSDADTARFLEKLSNLVDPAAWAVSIDQFDRLGPYADHGALIALQLAACALFLWCERVSIKRDPDRPYALFRTPLATVILCVLCIFFFGAGNGGFVYARQ